LAQHGGKLLIRFAAKIYIEVEDLGHFLRLLPGMAHFKRRRSGNQSRINSRLGQLFFIIKKCFSPPLRVKDKEWSV